jgi:thiol:disulfide interchange protein DsbD
MSRNPFSANIGSSILATGLIVAALFGLAAPEAHAAPIKHVEAGLVAETRTAAPGRAFYVALHQRIIPGWHTYWRNPGDAGEATTLDWTLPPGWSASPIIWPQPERFVAGPLMNYVYSTEVFLPVAIKVPADAKPGRTILAATANWLVCKDVCVPETAKLSLPISVAPAGTQSQPDPAGKAVADAVASAPKPAGIKASFDYLPKAAQVRLDLSGAALRGEDVSKAYFYPYDGTVLDQVRPQVPAKAGAGMTLQLPAGYAFTHGKAPAELDGIITFGPGRAFEISARPVRQGAAVAIGRRHDGGSGGLPGALAFAFIGGLILNLMPCVFPVLSIKAAALARHVESPGKAAAEGLTFLIGCVLTFVVLAGALIVAQQAGQAVGWGFQLQSPGVVAALALLMLAIGLNLSGVFEIGLSVQGAGQGLAAQGGLVGAFFTGVLAVVVAAPCTAPFMAGAIGWAFTRPPLEALSVFVALGVGLAAPFVLVSLIPGLFKRLPRPGAWMEGLKKTLAFPMYGSAAWLAWVFVQQAGANGLALLFASAVFVAFAVWLFGVSQRASKPWLPRLGAAAGLVIAVPLAVMGSAMTVSAGISSGGPSPVSGIASEPWSPAKVDSLRAAGRPVFVDFTAAWCVTCQVNERTALATAGVADAFKRTNTAYLRADWTNRNSQIADALKAQGRAGVPLYLLYDTKGGEPQVLPQILTEGGVVTALNAASTGKPDA